MSPLLDLRVKIFADGAELQGLLKLYKNPLIKGFTTNPSLVKKAGVTNFIQYAKEVCNVIPDRSLSFEVFADKIEEMERQAMIIKEWGPNVYVKIPVTNTEGISTLSLVSKLSQRGVKINLTAVFTLEQVEAALHALDKSPGAYISIFAGRIADSGRDPIPTMSKAVELARKNQKVEILWASTREIFNIFEADRIGVQIITVPHSILEKLDGVGTTLERLTSDTVTSFYKDASSAGFVL